jgi:hypothetical protein
MLFREPELPDEPDVPEVPEDPELPEVPDVPEEPEEPDEPEDPEVPPPRQVLSSQNRAGSHGTPSQHGSPRPPQATQVNPLSNPPQTRSGESHVMVLASPLPQHRSLRPPQEVTHRSAPQTRAPSHVPSKQHCCPWAPQTPQNLELVHSRVPLHLAPGQQISPLSPHAMQTPVSVRQTTFGPAHVSPSQHGRFTAPHAKQMLASATPSGRQMDPASHSSPGQQG